MSDIIQNQTEDDQLYNIEGFSEEEQLEIRQQIDKISSHNRISVTEELFKINPAKKGGTLPLIINIIGLLAIAASFYLTNRYFQQKEQTMAMEESSYESTEGSVIGELKRQAEEKLNKKQEEIRQIQNELSKLDKESASLKENMDSQIKSKEQELRLEMEAALAKERTRLQSQNISTVDLENQLKEFQTNKENTLQADVEVFKNESTAALKAKEEELAKAKQIANDILEKANRDKAAIEADTQKREAELTAQFNAEKEALTRESSEATQQLKKLSELKKNEQLIQDQITGSYNNVIASLNEGKYNEAQIGIDNIRKLLDDPNIINLPAISKRKNVELFFLDTLEKEIKQSGARTTTDFSTMTRAAEILITARKSAELGATAAAEGNQYDAKRYYNEALSSLPQISRAVTNLRKIEASDRNANSKEYISLGNLAINKGQISEALKQYRNAAAGTAPNNTITLNTALDGIEKSLNLDKENTKKQYEKQIANFNSQLDDLDETIAGLKNDLDKSKETINRLGTEQEADKTSMGKLEDEKNSLKKNLADLETEKENIDSTISALNNKIDDSNKTIEQLKQNATVSSQTIDNLKTEVRKSAIAVETLTKRADRAVKRASDLENELNDAVNQIVDLLN
ncbi:MAG: hypothetical protein J7L71_11970 [Spirochaetaceae bacterium]|nr:hypothetical protein [Spirochaetaceae bacterium]